MSLFQCENCGCCENTAKGFYHSRNIIDWPEKYKGKKLCSVCAPIKFPDGTATRWGKWHNIFPRTFLPKGEFKTNGVGNLEHIESGSEDFHQYALTTPK